MFKMSIKNRLILSFLAVLILPTAAIGWFSYQKAAGEVTNQIIQSGNQSLRSTNNQVDDLISQGLADIDYMAKQINASMINGPSSPKIKPIFDPYKAVHPQNESVYFGSKDGVMVQSPDKKLEDGFDPRKASWYIKAMENKGKAVLSEPMFSSSADGKGTVTVIASKAAEDGSGVVATNIELTKLAKQISSIKIGEKGYVFIMGKDQKYIVHPTQKLGDVNNEVFMKGFYDKESGTNDYFFMGDDKKSVFVTNKYTGWKIIGSIVLPEIAAATREILYTTLAVVAVSILIGAILIFWIVRSITRPLKELVSTTDNVANGDLTEDIKIRSKDELGQLASSMNNMIHKLRGLIGGVMNSSHNVAAASQEISATTEEIASGSMMQAEAAQHMQELFGELNQAINSVAGSAEQAAELAATTTSIARDGGDIVRKSVDSMSQVSDQMNVLKEDSNKIGDIIEVIGDIAEQTNLLALNAAIEAARAGDQGRGFAVVADEVRKLAERSGEATKQITTIIKGMQENTNKSVTAVSNGVNQSQETGKAFEKIVEMINQTEHKVTEIAAASEEQAAQTTEVLNSMEKISSASEGAAAASEETAATSQSLARLAEELNQSISVFKVK
jgi:methyl-accepting chemotaxis protein